MRIFKRFYAYRWISLFVLAVLAFGGVFYYASQFWRTIAIAILFTSFIFLVTIIFMQAFYIKERKQTEEVLRKSEARYRSVVEDQTEFIVRWLPDGTRTFVNDSYCRYFKQSHDELIGSSFLPLIVEGDRKHIHKRIESLTPENPVVTYEERIFLPDGRIGWQQWSDRVILDKEGRVIEYQSVGRDITKRKRAEEQLQQYAAKLEEANTELSQYAYMASHDLKTSLRAIHNYVDFLREDLETILREEQRMYLDGIDRSVREADALVEGMLQFSQIGKQNFITERIQVGTFLQKLIAELDLPSAVKIVIMDNWPTLDVEPVLFRQIFQHLINNAVEFNTSLQKQVELGWQPLEESSYEFFVRDNGIGIDPQYQEQIFRVFERLHTKEEFRGSGIGLAIARKAVEKLGGSIRIESTPGKGSTFFVTLPKTKTN